MSTPHTDEGALVKAARELGVVFKARTPDSIIIEVVGTSIHVYTLYIADFNTCMFMCVYVEWSSREI